MHIFPAVYFCSPRLWSIRLHFRYVYFLSLSARARPRSINLALPAHLQRCYSDSFLAVCFHWISFHIISWYMYPLVCSSCRNYQFPTIIINGSDKIYWNIQRLQKYYYFGHKNELHSDLLFTCYGVSVSQRVHFRLCLQMLTLQWAVSCPE